MKKLLIVAPLLLWLAGCGDVPARTEHAAVQAPVSVHAAPAALDDLPAIYEATGTVRAPAVASVSSKLAGYVQEVKIQIGDRVKAGQLLIALDPRDLDTAVRRSEAARAELRSAIPEAESAVSGAKAALDLTQVTFERMQALYNKKSISHQEFDEASAHLKSAQAAHDMARARRAQLDDRAAQADQEVRAAQLNYAYTQLTAPFDGIVTTKTVEPGNLAMPGAPLLTIEREGAYRLEALVDESRLSSIRIGQAVTVHLDGLDQSLAGRVSEIVPQVDAAARAGTVKIDLPPLASIKSGAFGRALFASTMQRKSMAIATAAVQEHGQLQSVFVAENGIARTRLITLGAKFNSRAEVLSGLTEGELVIAPIPPNLVEGSPVELLP
ncbi:MAG TPA: efflux RND transporter periplasmic adaptor subunit [Bryobacteraceae bacterium]|jgi:RND family efflux transporter MFP subunit